MWRKVTTLSQIEALELYARIALFLQENGWRRQELGSGWWWREGFEEATLGGAFEQQLDILGVDQRDRVPGEPDGEYWG